MKLDCLFNVLRYNCSQDAVTLILNYFKESVPRGCVILRDYSAELEASRVRLQHQQQQIHRFEQQRRQKSSPLKSAQHQSIPREEWSRINDNDQTIEDSFELDVTSPAGLYSQNNEAADMPQQSHNLSPEYMQPDGKEGWESSEKEPISSAEKLRRDKKKLALGQMALPDLTVRETPSSMALREAGKPEKHLKASSVRQYQRSRSSEMQRGVFNYLLFGVFSSIIQLLLFIELDKFV